VPSVVYNTVDQPIFPTTGRRLTASMEMAGLGGNTNYFKPRLEGIMFLRQNTRMSLGVRAQFEYVKTYRQTEELPIFERLFLGGEYSIRGFDTRTIGPQDPLTGLVLGGNKSLLFNVEQNFNIASQVRFVLFYDAGQVQPGPQRSEDGTIAPGRSFVLKDFKTSTGAEIRFFMPVLNVPFRLIFAQNLQRSGVLNNSLQPQKAFQFRFAVGTTF
jgi:outer membrane protein insertion porin family